MQSPPARLRHTDTATNAPDRYPPSGIPGRSSHRGVHDRVLALVPDVVVLFARRVSAAFARAAAHCSSRFLFLRMVSGTPIVGPFVCFSSFLPSFFFLSLFGLFSLTPPPPSLLLRLRSLSLSSSVIDSPISERTKPYFGSKSINSSRCKTERKARALGSRLALALEIGEGEKDGG